MAVPSKLTAETPDFEEAAAADPMSPDSSKRRLAAFEAVYRGIWRDEPPPGEVEAGAAQMNLTEWAAYQRSKPAYPYSVEYKERAQMLERSLPGAMRRMVG